MSDSDLVDDAKGTLPAYAGRMTHTYELTGSNNRSWLVMKLRSVLPCPPDQLPRMVEGQPIEGIVEVDFKDKKDIKSISVSVSGPCLCRSQDGEIAGRGWNLTAVPA